MNEIYLTVAGNVVADPDARVTRTGVPFAVFRVASTVRRLNPQTREYEDAATNYVNVTAFRALGANVAASLSKGDPVVVHGRMRVNQFVRADNSHGTTVEIDAYSIGHDLARGTSTFTRVSRAQVDTSDRMADEEVQAAHDAASSPRDADPLTDGYQVSDPAPESSFATV